MPAVSPSLPDLRAQFDMQVDFLNQVSRDARDGSWQAARSAAGVDDVGAAHNPT